MGGFSVLDFLFGPAASKSSFQSAMTAPYAAISPQPASPAEDTVRSDGGSAPYKNAGDLDDFGRETPEMQAAYLRLFREEPTVKAAVKGKANAVACLDVSVKPANPRRPMDGRAAEFVDWTVRTCVHGWDGMMRNTLLPAFLQGFSVGEIVLKHHDRSEMPEWAGQWGLKYLKSKNVNRLSLQLDAHRNVLGIVNHVQGLATYPRRKFVLFSHDELFDDPFGASDLRGCYRAAQLIDEAFKLWYFREKVYSGPLMKGTYTDKTNRQSLELAMAEARAGGFLSLPKGTDVEIINLAASINADGTSKLIDKGREDIFLSVRGGFTQFMPGGDSGERHNSGLNKSSVGDPDEALIASLVMRRFGHDLVPALMRGFPAGTGVPTIKIAGVNWAETQTQLTALVTVVKELGMPIQPGYVYEITGFPEETDPTQAIGYQAPQALPPGGMPGQPGQGPPGSPEPPKPGPEHPPTGGSQPAPAAQPPAAPPEPAELPPLNFSAWGTPEEFDTLLGTLTFSDAAGRTPPLE